MANAQKLIDGAEIVSKNVWEDKNIVSVVGKRVDKIKFSNANG